jgi:hypothetical protein
MWIFSLGRVRIRQGSNTDIVAHKLPRREDCPLEKQGRSGTLKFTELVTEYLDEHDEVVITARTVAVLTESAVPVALFSG